MIIVVLILLFIGWVVYELWLNPMIPYYEHEKKCNEEFLKEYPKGMKQLKNMKKEKVRS